MAKAKSPPKVNPRRPILINAAELITQRVDELLSYESCLSNPDNVYKLHEMRIAGKRLRYTMEVFQPVYTRYTDAGAEFGAALQVVKDLQEHLGVLHDADVLVPEILQHLGRLVKNGYGLPTAAEQAGMNEVKSEQSKTKSAAYNAHSAKSGKPANADKTAHVHKSDKSGKSAKALPIVGVHQVDYAACDGLLTLCAQLRAERDARYAQLTQEWQQIRANQVFENLRHLLTRNQGIEGRKGEEKTAGQGTGNREQGTEGIQSAIGNRKSAMDSSFILHPSSLPAPPTLNPQPSTYEEPDAADRQTPQTPRAPGEPGHIAAARRRVAAPEKAGKPGQQGRQGKQRQDANAPARAVKPVKPGSAVKPERAVARNGAARSPRHSRPGTDTDSGAGKGGAD